MRGDPFLKAQGILGVGIIHDAVAVQVEWGVFGSSGDDVAIGIDRDPRGGYSGKTAREKQLRLAERIRRVGSIHVGGQQQDGLVREVQ